MKKIKKPRKKKPTVNWRHVLAIGIFLAGVFLIKNSAQFTDAKSFFVVSTPTPAVSSVTPSPTQVPTPTLTPTPTPIPGYCLYVPVLMYHHVQPQQMAIEKKETALSVDSGTFDAQMAYVASSGYTTITTRQLVDALINKSALPAKSMVLTFDDGYKNNFEYAHPVLQKYGLTANLVLSSGLVGGENYLSWDQVRQMNASGKWHMVNHTWSHYSLGRGDNAKITYEVSTALQQIRDNTGQSPDTFAYPYGTIGGIDVLQSLGIKGAFSTIPGSRQCDSILFALRRTRIGNSSLSSYGF